MKRIVSLMLCLLMLALTFSSCSSDEAVETIETSTRKAVTLAMYVITEDGTTPEAAQAVEDAVNVIVKSKYTTALDIEFITEAEYYNTVEARLAGMKSAYEKAAVETEAAESGDESESAAVTTAATIVNEYGVTELRYPDLSESQIDIFMIADYAKYVEYAKAGHLYNLDDTVNNASKKLKDYIYPSILESAKVDGSYYAIPNNKPMGGESTYVVIDKAMAEEFDLQVGRISTLTDLKPFFAWVKATKEGVTPLAGFFDDVNARYMNFDKASGAFNSEFSLVGDYGSSSAKIGEAVSLFANDSYKNEIVSLAEMNFAGYFGDAGAASFAAAVKTGNTDAILADSENYEIVVLDSEGKATEELCSSMFAVSKYTHDEESFKRAMEIITLLNTDDEFRNLLQYGIRDVNFEEYDGVLTRLNNDYMMDIYKTGNAYMAYPEEGMPVNMWEIAKKQNLASAAFVTDAFGGFTASAEADTAEAEALANASAEVYKALAGAEDIDSFKAVVDSVTSQYADVISAFLDTSNAASVYALYKAQ